MQHEVELKLDLDSASADAIEASGLHRRACTTERLRSHYFDTPEYTLRAAGLSLRLRERDGEWIQTVKADGPASTGLFDRADWEIPAPGAELIDDPRTPIASLLGHRSGELIELSWTGMGTTLRGARQQRLPTTGWARWRLSTASPPPARPTAHWPMPR